MTLSAPVLKEAFIPSFLQHDARSILTYGKLARKLNVMIDPTMAIDYMKACIKEEVNRVFSKDVAKNWIDTFKAVYLLFDSILWDALMGEFEAEKKKKVDSYLIFEVEDMNRVSHRVLSQLSDGYNFSFDRGIPVEIYSLLFIFQGYETVHPSLFMDLVGENLSLKYEVPAPYDLMFSEQDLIRYQNISGYLLLIRYTLRSLRSLNPKSQSAVLLRYQMIHFFETYWSYAMVKL